MAQKFNHGDSFPFMQNRSSRLGDLHYCQVCGRELGQSGTYWVEVVDGGDIHDSTTYGEADTQDSGYMGFYPVGISCSYRFEKSVLVWDGGK